MSDEIFVLCADRLLSLPLRVHIVGRDWHDPARAYDYTREGAADTAVEHVVRGALDVEIDGRAFRAKAGDAYLLPAGSHYRVREARGARWAKTWFVLGGELWKEILAAHRLDRVYHVPKAPVRPLFERMLRLARSGGGGPGGQERLVALAVETLLRLATVSARRRSGVSAEVLRGQAYLDACVGRRATLKGLAAAMNRSPGRAARAFKAEMRITPYAYLLNRKLERARVLLAHSPLMVKEIAYSLGFSDPYYFSNLFKRKAGVSPAHFRAKGEDRT